jgi:ribose/xylose/arabinose/galactoside ABC-type transport system permease subunit
MKKEMRLVIESGARVLALAGVFIAFWILVGPSFVSAGNIENIFRQSAVFAMGGLGMTMIMLTGGIDLAAGSTIALSMVVTAMTLRMGVPEHPVVYTPLAVLAGVLSGMIVGMVQGLLITWLKIVPFIITLGGLVSIRGFTKRIADNQEISPDTSNWLYRKLMFPVQSIEFNFQLVPFGVWLTLLAAIAAGLFLRYTRLGRHIYAVGSNEATARLCGVSVEKTKVLVYALGGAFFGLAGVLEFSKLNMGQPTGAMMYELYIIAACVIGGTSLRGGVGTIFGTVVGALLIGVLNIGAQQAGWEKPTQEIVIGLIIITAVALNQLRTGRLRSN